MAKVKVEWTIEVTETYTTEIDFEDFVAMFDEGTAPTLEEAQAGQFDTGDIDVHQMADSETDANREFASVDERYFSDIKIIEA